MANGKIQLNTGPVVCIMHAELLWLEWENWYFLVWSVFFISFPDGIKIQQIFRICFSFWTFERSKTCYFPYFNRKLFTSNNLKMKIHQYEEYHKWQLKMPVHEIVFYFLNKARFEPSSLTTCVFFSHHICDLSIMFI